MLLKVKCQSLFYSATNAKCVVKRLWTIRLSRWFEIFERLFQSRVCDLVILSGRAWLTVIVPVYPKCDDFG